MPGILTLPRELLDLIIETLVISIGIARAIRLRITSHSFDASIMQAICVTQVVSMNDPATPELAHRMSPSLRGEIIAATTITESSPSYLIAVRQVNQVLDASTNDQDKEGIEARHKHVAATVKLANNNGRPIDARVEAQNILCAAAAIGNVSIVERMLSTGVATANGSTDFFEMPLTLAARNGHLEVVRYLLSKGAHQDAVLRSWLEHSRLHTLSDWTKEHDITVLSNALSIGPPSALRSAILGGHDEVVELLLFPQHSLTTTSVEYLRAMVAAASVGRLEYIKFLLTAVGKRLGDFPDLGDFMIFPAIRYSHEHVVSMLLENGVSVNAFPCPSRCDYHGTLNLAASVGNQRMAEFLLLKGADVEANEWGRENGTPIAGAAHNGQEALVELLLDHGADPVTGFLTAAESSQPRVIKYLLNRYPGLVHQADGAIGCRALFKAIMTGNLLSITILVEAGVPLTETQLPDGWSFPSPMTAAKMVGTWVTDHLLALGAKDTEDEVCTTASIVRGVVISSRTWEWASRY